eukprot:3204027-Amphidinium_carterae.1
MVLTRLEVRNCRVVLGPGCRFQCSSGWLAYLTGALVAHYEMLGGPVLNIGKPYGPVFQEAQRVLSLSEGSSLTQSACCCLSQTFPGL